MELLHFSDGMIHDCGSYTVEYMYTGHPVMYLVRGDNHAGNMIPYAREAYSLHYKGKTIEDVERFVESIINGRDPLMEQRLLFKKDRLMPPNGKTACQNIIDTILG